MHNQIAVVALTAAALVGCSPDHGGMGPRGAAALAAQLQAGATSVAAADDTPGAVYTLMNLTAAAGGNAVAVFTRAADGRSSIPARTRSAPRSGVASRASMISRTTPARCRRC